nr:exonuclease domain-containing protein [Mucilaginibacter sp. Bleaf8]
MFIDTEASGLPVNWKLPYSAEGNWPSAVQVSWIVYTKDGQEVKRENHYIRNDDFFITPKAMEIHGINPGFLAVKGEVRKDVIAMLAADLNQYQPLVIGHFIQLDYHILGADFYRAGIDNPLVNLPMFCTMTATTQLAWTPMQRSLRLGDLYAYLFYKPQEKQHDAAADAQATADCFFELLNRREITERSIHQQQQTTVKSIKTAIGTMLSLAVSFIVLVLIILIANRHL